MIKTIKIGERGSLLRVNSGHRVAFTLSEGGQSPLLKAHSIGRVAFTMAEVLITIGIIGVVAALTLPMFIENMSERANLERQVNIVQKITQATDKMRAMDELGQFSTTEEFVDALQKHLKIAKKCGTAYNELIENCWPTDKVTTKDGKEFEIKKVKTSENLNLKWEPKTNAVGLVLADGANIILAYNPTNLGVNQSEPIVPSPQDGFTYKFKNGKTKTYMSYTTNTTGGIAFIMDINGKAKPNSETIGETQNDIRSFNGARLSLGCVGLKQDDKCFYHPDSYTPVDCRSSNSSSSDYQYCKPTPSGKKNDYWAGAKKACGEVELELPTKKELATYAGGKNPYNISSSNYFWASDEHSDSKALKAEVINISSGHESYCYKYEEYTNAYGVLCVGN